MKALKTRSPIHLYYDNQNIDKVNLKIWIDKDISALNINTGPNYTLTSDAINSEVIFEISELLRSANQYEFEDDFYQRRDTAIYVLCEADILDSNGDRINLQYNFLRVRDGYVQRNEQTQIINNLLSTDLFNNWSSFESTIAPNEDDAFSGLSAFKVTQTVSGLYGGFNTVNENTPSFYTYSVYLKNADNTDISLRINGSDNQVIFRNQKIKNLNGNITGYDVTEVENNYYRYSVSGFFTNIQTVGIFFNNGNNAVVAFNPTLIKGDLINQSASDLVLQDNTNIFTTNDITVDVLFDRKFNTGFYGFNDNFRDIFSGSSTISSTSYNINFVDVFEDRVIADGGTFESEECLIDYLDEIGGYDEANDDVLKFEDIFGIQTKQPFAFSELCEPKYTPVKVSFINRFGVIQDLVFFKKRVDSYSTDEENYKANIITNGQVYPHLGQRRLYNKQAQASVKISSGFYPESFNTVFRQLLYSEMYWIDDEPAILTDSKWTEKTKVNDKLINYDFDFDFANDDINSIR